MLLNYQFTPAQKPNNQVEKRPVLVFLHGLFGDLNNLGIIARTFSSDYPILRLDLRNHGQSFHSPEMNYAIMAQDVANVLDELNIQNAILIGHSMGGKTAMNVAAQRPDLIEKLVVIDISPVDYNVQRNGNEHAQEFAALHAVKNTNASTRQQAKPILESYLKEPATVQFLLKAFDEAKPDKTRFNLTALEANYANIMGWQSLFFDKPTLFIKGGDSDYILPAYREQILAQFPKATSFTISGAKHWVHAEKPELVSRTIHRFIQSE